MGIQGTPEDAVVGWVPHLNDDEDDSQRNADGEDDDPGWLLKVKAGERGERECSGPDQLGCSANAKDVAVEEEGEDDVCGNGRGYRSQRESKVGGNSPNTENNTVKNAQSEAGTKIGLSVKLGNILCILHAYDGNGS
jgi:hypothetical protein